MGYIATVEREHFSISKRGISKSANGTVTIEVEKEVQDARLYHFHELPEWQKDNEMIMTGYVRETKSWKACLRLLSYFNNESVNIYTHLVPALSYFAVLLFFTDMLLMPSFPTTTVKDYVVVNLYLLGAFVCLMGSSCFHCLKQHSENQSDFWSKVDYIGIISLITCSLISIMYYGFLDRMDHFKAFTVVTLVLAFICSYCVLDDRFNSKNFRPIRAAFFVIFAMSAVVPIGIGIHKFGVEEVIQRIQLKHVGWEVLFYVTGAIIYGYRIPEIFAPGKFDMVGSSHQIFHIFVVIASVFHLRAVIGSYAFMHTAINAEKFSLL